MADNYNELKELADRHFSDDVRDDDKTYKLKDFISNMCSMFVPRRTGKAQDLATQVESDPELKGYPLSRTLLMTALATVPPDTQVDSKNAAQMRDIFMPMTNAEGFITRTSLLAYIQQHAPEPVQLVGKTEPPAIMIAASDVSPVEPSAKPKRSEPKTPASSTVDSSSPSDSATYIEPEKAGDTFKVVVTVQRHRSQEMDADDILNRLSQSAGMRQAREKLAANGVDLSENAPISEVYAQVLAHKIEVPAVENRQENSTGRG